MSMRPAEVIYEALLAPMPCPTCGSTNVCRCHVPEVGEKRLRWRADRIVAALDMAGMLHHHDEPKSDQVSIEDIARWLADQSRHPRYYGDLWRTLLDHEHNVEHAHAQAVKAAKPATQNVLIGLAAATKALLDYHAARRASEAVTGE